MPPVAQAFNFEPREKKKSFVDSAMERLAQALQIAQAGTNVAASAQQIADNTRGAEQRARLELLTRQLDPNSPEHQKTALELDALKTKKYGPGGAPGVQPSSAQPSLQGGVIPASMKSGVLPGPNSQYGGVFKELPLPPRPQPSGSYAQDQENLRTWEKETADRIRQNQTIQEKASQLTTNFGMARTADDAKQVKEAAELKAKFDRKIGDLIALRKKYGAEVLDREAVAKGKQLSKDLLLDYKKLSGLGVLSKTDIGIVEKIIPSDPLGYAPSQLVGQDPILSNLENFKSGMDDDFNSTLESRIQGYKAPQKQQTTNTGGDRKMPANAIQAAPPPPKPGDVVDGYQFVGGDPSNPQSWRKK